MKTMKDRDYLIDKYNATCTDNPSGSDELETYEYWLEKQLLWRIEAIEILQAKFNNVVLADVSGFTAADMERAYNNGNNDVNDVPFNIEYYR